MAPNLFRVMGTIVDCRLPILVPWIGKSSSYTNQLHCHDEPSRRRPDVPLYSLCCSLYSVVFTVRRTSRHVRGKRQNSILAVMCTNSIGETRPFLKSFGSLFRELSRCRTTWSGMRRLHRADTICYEIKETLFRLIESAKYLIRKQARISHQRHENWEWVRIPVWMQYYNIY